MIRIILIDRGWARDRSCVTTVLFPRNRTVLLVRHATFTGILTFYTAAKSSTEWLLWRDDSLLTYLTYLQANVNNVYEQRQHHGKCRTSISTPRHFGATNLMDNTCQVQRCTKYLQHTLTFLNRRPSRDANTCFSPCAGLRDVIGAPPRSTNDLPRPPCGWHSALTCCGTS